MDEQLAAIYGTGHPEQTEETDLEKTAAAELLVKLAAEEGMDLDNFSDQEVAEMINELQSPGIEHNAEAEATDESQEKFAEADFLGRVMAHSMVQELDNIEKEAGSKTEAAKKLLSRAGEATGVSQMLKGLKGVRAGRAMQKAEVAAGHKGRSLSAFPSAKGGLEELKGGAKRFGKRVGLPAAGVAGVGGAALAMKGKKKEASALEELAEQRAYEMAKEAGYIEEEQQQQQAGTLDQVVEQRALEICESNGIPVEWDK